MEKKPTLGSVQTPKSPDSGDFMTCTKCGARLPRSKLELMRTGTRRRVCNHCKWLCYVKPSRDRRILRELEQRHAR